MLDRDERTVRQLAALAQSTRFAIFRMLIRSGEAGLNAGRLSDRLEVAPNTLSAHLSVLSRAGLVTSRRDGRNIIYRCVMPEIAGMIDSLVNDCCAGHPEACAPLRSQKNFTQGTRC
jgi:DNA-binding transcriptional ArsR family regulator